MKVNESLNDVADILGTSNIQLDTIFRHLQRQYGTQS